MRVAVIARERDALSLTAYREHVVSELESRGVLCTTVSVEARACGDVDVLWDPGLGMRPVPDLLLRAPVPVVVTLHGLLQFALPGQDTARRWPDAVRRTVSRARVLRGWRRLRPVVSRVIAVSEYGAEEARAVLALGRELVTPIPHGVDHETFSPEGPRADRTRPYFLVVSQHQPKKNLGRILAAWAGLDPLTRPDLVAVVPGCGIKDGVPDGVELRRRPHGPGELAALYRGAVGFLMPSLHETFGMPLVEAMACGCPVITSDVTACPEVTGDAALHVDPRSVEAIRDAMRRVTDDQRLRETLRARGIRRATAFRWETSGALHEEVFTAVLRDRHAEVRR